MTRLASRRVDAVMVSDMRKLPLASGRVGGLLAFYSLIHLRRQELGSALAEFRRVLRPGGGVLIAAHGGQGQVEVNDLLGEPVPFVATLFQLDELAAATRPTGLRVTSAEHRPPHASESLRTTRLYLEAERVRAASRPIRALGG
jgi:SAM-dependent methyltransferase